MKGIKYDLSGETNRRRINNYHRNKPPFRDFSTGATKFDVKNIQSKVTQIGNHYKSNYTIGFEVEKNSFGLNRLREFELISCFETDGSCGVEAVTNILPLLPPSQWRNKIFDIMFKAQRIINDSESPSNFRCGGHMTIGVKGFNGSEIQQKIRGNSGILYALFRKRLKNSYCSEDNRMTNDSRAHWKYRVSKIANHMLLEYRLPSRIISYKQMFRRYEIMYTIVDFTFTNPNGRFSTLLNKVKPIILSMYEGDTEKTDKIIKLSKHFRKYILTGVKHPDIVVFFPR